MLILTRELSDNTLSWQQQDLRCQVELISCSSYVCSFGSATLFVPPTNPFVTSCFFFQCPIHFILGICILSSVHHFSDSCWLSSGRWPVAARAAAAIDSSWPATATCCFRGWSAQRLRRWTWNHAAPNVLPLVRRCIQWLERGIHEMRLYRFLLFYQLPRALQLSFQRHQRPPLMDLDFNWMWKDIQFLNPFFFLDLRCLPSRWLAPAAELPKR